MKNYKDLEILKHFKKICLIGHIDPDTDALSSMVVFCNFLKTTFKIKTVDIFAECNHIENSYAPIVEATILNPALQNYDCAIMIDSPNTDRLGKYKKLFTNSPFKIVIDHHNTNHFDGDLNIVHTTSSTCEIVYLIAKEFNYKFTTADKGKIYAGIITDTNNFTVGNFNSSTFEVVSECIDEIDNTAIYNHFFGKNSLLNMQLLSIAIQNIKTFEDGKILFTYITKEESQKFNASHEDFTGIINRIATITGNALVCFVQPKDQFYYVSMRAKNDCNVAKIAKNHNGGGHNGAAAFISHEEINEIEKYIVNEFKEELKNYSAPSENLF